MHGDRVKSSLSVSSHSPCRYTDSVRPNPRFEGFLHPAFRRLSLSCRAYFSTR
jgi:hypothetical protein